MSFDRLAPHYSWMEALLAGRRLQRSRVAWLDALAGAERILIVGVGHGHFLRACARRFPEARITSVDASAGMLREAERRARRAGLNMRRLEFVHATLPEWRPPAGRFDAIVTHFFLDCFPPDTLAAVIDVLAHSARPGARWLLADFALPERGWRRRRARMVHRLMYGFFRKVTKLAARCVTPPDSLLSGYGFELAGRRTTEWGLLRSDIWRRPAP
ncbi:MAG TPA: class I SAM-dependent methyltransferase [Opitutaceae bacterium]|nr:class I SAM-dependent methyltransferase [Opitutaceae bacterium]